MQILLLTFLLPCLHQQLKVIIMNKKATTIPWEFIIGILVTILFFVPACLIISDILKFSNEAKESFNKFAVALNDMKQAQDETLELVSLILDDKTAVVYFESQEHVEVSVHASAGYVSYVVYFERPSSPECVEGACICLWREFNVEYNRSGFGMFIVKPTHFWCKKSSPGIKYNFTIEDPIRKYNSCGSGKPVNVRSYYCKQGFIIERNIIKEIISDSPKKSYFELSAARAILIMAKEGDNIVLKS